MENNDLFQLFVSFPAFLINILAFFVLLRSSKLPYQIRIFSLNLCVTDCFTCLILCIDRRAFGLLFGTTDMKYFLILVFSQTALIIITYFNCDRFLAFKMAMRYYCFLSPTRVKVACALAWCFGSVMTSLQFSLWSKQNSVKARSMRSVAGCLNTFSSPYLPPTS